MMGEMPLDGRNFVSSSVERIEPRCRCRQLTPAQRRCRDRRDCHGSQLGAVPTPVESPESNGMAEAFVRISKRDYFRVGPIGNAAAALSAIDTWREGYSHRASAFPA
jgi:hypothetical protein